MDLRAPNEAKLKMKEMGLYFLSQNWESTSICLKKVVEPDANQQIKHTVLKRADQENMTH